MNPFNRFASAFRKNRKVYVFFICFVIAAMFWFLLALTKNYPSKIEVSVTYENFPPHMVVANELPKKLLLSVNTSGYRLISLKSGKGENNLHIDILSLTGIEAGTRIISSEMLAQSFIQQLGSDVEINSISPDSIMLDLSPSVSVKLPVKENLDVTFEKQYEAVSPVKISPDSVVATIPMSLAGKIKHIETEKITVKNLKASLKNNVKLLVPSGTSLSMSEAEINLDVEKFTEGNLEVPLNLINVPRGLKMKIFPDRVTVKYLVALSQYDKVKPDLFSVIANASQASVAKDKLDVQVISSPVFVRSVSFQPEKVEFLLKR